MLAQARLALAQASAHVSVAVDIAALRQLHCDTVLRRDRYGAVTIALLLVEALLVAGLRDEAVEALVALLKQAATVGLQQTLVDCSERVAKLIDGIVQGAIVPVGDVRELLPYAGALMSRRRRYCTADARSVGDPARSMTAMGLSDRERAIIGLMGRGLTNKQMAIRLRIAPETVKSHVKRLYTEALGAEPDRSGDAGEPSGSRPAIRVWRRLRTGIAYRGRTPARVRPLNPSGIHPQSCTCNDRNTCTGQYRSGGIANASREAGSIVFWVLNRG